MPANVNKVVIVYSWQILELNLLFRQSNHVQEESSDKFDVTERFYSMDNLSSQSDLTLFCMDTFALIHLHQL